MRKILILVLLGVLLCAMPVSGAQAVEYRKIAFPVEGPVSYSDDFGDPRSGGRSHEGNDLMGNKLQKLLAAVSGSVTFVRIDASGTSGNMLTIRDSQGYQYRYIHINNDTPGTDDGAKPSEWIFAPGIQQGSVVTRGTHVAYLGDSGNAEGTAPHLHFEIRRPDGSALDPWASLRLSQGLPAHDQCRWDENPAPNPSPGSADGYWVVGSDGGIFTFGNLEFYGSMGGRPLARAVNGMAPTPSGSGYWLVASDGGVFAFGDAPYVGSMGGSPLARPVVGIAPTPSGGGYWMVASDGGVFAFGDAGFHGSMGGRPLAQPVVGIAPTPSGGGYWMVASDGGIFAFGDAAFYGSMGGRPLARPVVGIAAHPQGTGYWMTASDGGIFAFGSAGYFGSLPGFGLCAVTPASSMAPSATGSGYWIQTVDGTTVSFGDAQDHGSVRALSLSWRPETIQVAPVKR